MLHTKRYKMRPKDKDKLRLLAIAVLFSIGYCIARFI